MGRGHAPAPAIPMTEMQNQLLSRLGRQHKTPQQVAKRIRILLMAHEGHSNSHIKRELGISLNTVKSWRRRWLSEYEELLKFESAGESDYSQVLLSVLKDIPRSGAPKVFTLAQEQQIVALACEKPVQHDIPISDWTYQMLAHVAIAKGIVATISPAQVGRILKKQSTSTA